MLTETFDPQQYLPGSADIFVTVQSHLQDKIILASGIEIYLPSNTAPGKFASVEATVAGIGSRCPLDLKAGDTVAVDYGVFSLYDDVAGVREYRNISRMGDRLVWRVEVSKANSPAFWQRSLVFARKRAQKWEAIGGHCLLEAVDMPQVENAETQKLKALGLAAPESLEKKVWKGHGRFVNGPEDIAHPGDIVAFKEEYRNTYVFPDGKEYIKLRTDQIAGRYVSYDTQLPTAKTTAA